MTTGEPRRRRFVAFGSRIVKRQHQGMGNDEVDAFSEEELARRPEVRIINKYALGRAYVRIGLRGVGALALLWATVVLLGGFVSVLSKTDFWYLTFIAFLQAAGLSDANGDDSFMFFANWMASPGIIISWRDKEKSIFSKISDVLIFVIFIPVMYFAAFGPIVCIGLTADRLRKQDYGSADGDVSKANLKPALNLFYSVSLAHSAIYVLLLLVEGAADDFLVDCVSKRHGFSPQVLDGYFQETKRICSHNPASTKNWNLITYGASLLDSEVPEDYTSGVRVVTMLIEQGIPIRRLLIRSPGHRIHKLLRALVWRSPVEGETRRFAARIVEHIAGDLNLAQFPGASECVSSLLDTSFLDNESSFPTTLLDTSCNSNGDQDVLQLLTRRRKARMKSSLSVISRPEGKGDEEKEEEEEGKVEEVFTMSMIRVLTISMIRELSFTSIIQAIQDASGSTMQEEYVDGDATKGTNEDLILQGLRILENLATDQHNYAVIYSTKGLVSKIVAPVSSDSLTENIKTNAAWIQVVDASLKVVSHLMRAPGDTGREMRRQIADSCNAVRNLEAVLGLQSSSSCILELQMRAMEVLAQLFFHGSTSWAGKRREDFIERALHIFCTVEWMECYLAEEKKIKIDKETSNQLSTGTWMDSYFNKACRAQAEKKMKLLEDKKMKEAKETASRLKEKAGEALAMLSMGNKSNSEAIKCFTDVVRRLTEMVDSKTIKCKINETETVEAEMKIGCRISAAVILKHLCPHFTTVDVNYVRNTTLKKVLVELLHVTTESQAQESSTIASTLQWWEHCIGVRRNDIENPRDGSQEEQIQSHKQQPEERKLQAVLLSLCADMCARYSIKAPDLATMVAPQVSREDFVGKLTKMVEENSHATPACLAILKLTCQMVTELILDNQTDEAMETKKTITGMVSQVVAKLSEASKMMARVESCMLFADIKVDYYGVPVKPLLSVLVKQAEEHLEQRKDELGMNTSAARKP